MSAAPRAGLSATTNSSKIGEINDALVGKSGKITGLVIGVGRCLGAGEKDVIVPFTAVKTSKRDVKCYPR